MNDECRTRISEKVTEVMKDKKGQGMHVGRPARFMFAEDVDSAPKGRVGKNTIIRTEEEIYGYARSGFSLYYVAKDLNVGYNVLIFEMKKADPDNPRFKGTKDRFTEYNTILRGSNQCRF